MDNGVALPLEGEDCRYLLSAPQRQFYFLESLTPGSRALRLPALLVWRGELAKQTFIESLQELVRRHPTLRSRFFESEACLYQSALNSMTVDVTFIDQCASPISNDEEWLSGIRDSDTQPFNLGEGRLIRVWVYRRRADFHGVLIVLHHIVADGWAVGVLATDIARIYLARSRGDPLHVDPCNAYREFIDDQASMETEDRLSIIDHWRHKLAGAPASHNLPRRHMDRRGVGRTYILRAESEVLPTLQSLARGEGTTLFAACAAITCVLLQRLSGDEDVVVGVPYASRNHKRWSRVVGCFVNVLPLRVKRSDCTNFKELIKTIGDDILYTALQFSISFESLVRELHIERIGLRNPVFQIALNHANLAKRLFEGPGLSVERRIVPNGGAGFDIEWYFIEDSEGLTLSLTYDADMFDEKSVAWWASQWVSIAKAVVGSPSGNPFLLPALTDTAINQTPSAISNVNATKEPFDKQPHEDFVSWAKRAPDAEATVNSGYPIKYRELNHASNQLARHLALIGVGRNCFVGLLMCAGTEWLVGLMAIWKSGAIVVPLSMGDVVARGIVGVPAVVLFAGPSEALHSAMDFDSSIRSIDLRDASQWAHLEATDPLETWDSNDSSSIAYSYYRPTVTPTHHRELLSFTAQGLELQVLWMRREFQLSQRDIILHVWDADASDNIRCALATLASGAKWVNVQPAAFHDVQLLAALLVQERISILHIGPTLLAELLDQSIVAGLMSLRHVLCAGESVDMPLIETFRKVWPRARIHNSYGSLWASSDVTAWSADEVTYRGQAPAGHPVAGTQIYIVDELMKPVPVGMCGEVYLSGPASPLVEVECAGGLLTRYAPSPCGTSGKTLYRPGDRARFMLDGKLDCIGWNNSQREPRASEYMTSVELAPIVVRGGTLKLSELAHLGVPQIREESEYSALRTQTEILLAKVWKDLLKVAQVRPTDDFFSLGGHSLLAIQLISRVRRALHVDMSITEVFESPILSDLAARVDAIVELERIESRR